MIAYRIRIGRIHKTPEVEPEVEGGRLDSAGSGVEAAAPNYGTPANEAGAHWITQVLGDR